MAKEVEIDPVIDVLKTTSATRVPKAPKDFPFQMDPSSRTSLVSEIFQGRLAIKQGLKNPYLGKSV